MSSPPTARRRSPATRKTGRPCSGTSSATSSRWASRATKCRAGSARASPSMRNARPIPAWGQAMNPHYREMVLGGDLTPVGDLSSAFMTPKSPLHVQFAYYESSLVVEYIVQKFGLDSLKKILADLGDGVNINDAIAQQHRADGQTGNRFCRLRARPRRKSRARASIGRNRPSLMTPPESACIRDLTRTPTMWTSIQRLMRQREAETNAPPTNLSCASMPVHQRLQRRHFASRLQSAATKHAAPNYWELMRAGKDRHRRKEMGRCQSRLEKTHRALSAQTGSDSAYPLLAAAVPRAERHQPGTRGSAKIGRARCR